MARGSTAVPLGFVFIRRHRLLASSDTGDVFVFKMRGLKQTKQIVPNRRMT